MAEGRDGVASLERDWRALADSAPIGAAFLGYAFALAAAGYHERRGERVLIARVEAGGRTGVILPIAIARRSGVRVATLLGDPIAQYGDALLAPSAPRHLAEVALSSLIDGKEADVFSFRRVRSDAALNDALSRLARPVGAATRSPFADIAGTTNAEDLLLALGGAKRQRERRRSRKRLSECGPLAFEIRRGQDALEWIAEAIVLKRARLATAGDASPVIDDPETVAAFQEIARDPFDGNGLVVARLTVGDAPAAYELGFVRGGAYHAYLGATADRYRNASPGSVLMEETFRWCVAEGLRTFDLLPSGDAYKDHWANGAVEVRDHIASTTISGAIYADAWLGAVRPRLRSGLALLPAAMRRLIGAAALRTGVR